jgi:sugar lactone lactonase YvrE/quercetin dioxygenase-like cupin family protein
MIIRDLQDAPDIAPDRWGVPGLEQRVMLHDENLMVVWLRIPPGTEFPLHSHPHVQIGFQVSGRSELTGENGTVEIGPGTAYMFAPNEVHGSRAIGDEPVIQLDAFHPAREDYAEEGQEKATALPVTTPVGECEASSRKERKMAVDVRSERLRALVDEHVEVEQLATGFTFTEGPIWNPSGQFLLFSDMPGDTRRRWDESSSVQVVASPSNKGNGMTLDAEGRLIVCEHSTSSLVRMDPSGTGEGREVLASHYDGVELNSPNDVCVKSDGSIWFTDPWYGRMPGFGVERERGLGWQGVFRIAPEGGEPQLVVDKDAFEQPNGLCFSPDESLLYINDTPKAQIKVYDVGTDGSLSNGRVFIEGVGTGVIEEGVVDGMKCDEQGNVWVTGPGGVWVIDPDGGHLGTISVPENVGNLAWGGPDWKWLFLPSSTSLYRVTTKIGPRREPYMT